MRYIISGTLILTIISALGSVAASGQTKVMQTIKVFVYAAADDAKKDGFVDPDQKNKLKPYCAETQTA
jgi:hypothetical protein